MDRTLVLNASYQPICVVNWQRAIVLVLDEKADPVEVGEFEARSAFASFNVPSVIRLRVMVRVPWKADRLPWSKRGVLRRDSHACGYCGQFADTVDHVMPSSRGGADTWENTVAACGPCNSRKADRTVSEAGMPLLVKPGKPKGFQAVTLAVGAPAKSWEPYLAYA